MRLSTPRVFAHLRHLLLGCCVLTTLALSAPAQASPPSSIKVQATLQDAAGNALDGVYTLVFRLYDQPSGGVPLASETRMVTVTEGLFDVSLDTLGNPDLYRSSGGGTENWHYGVSVAGQAELTPRLKIGTVPFAHVSTSLEGDVVTTPGSMVIRAEDGSPDDEIVASVVPGTASVAINVKGTGADKNRVSSGSYEDSTVQSMSLSTAASGTREINQRNLPTAAISEMKFLPSPGHTTLILHRAYADSAAHVVSIDTDGDSDPESDASTFVAPGTCSVAIKTKGTGADKGRIINTTYPDSTEQIMTLSTAGGASSGIESKTKPKKSLVIIHNMPSPGHTTKTVSTASEDTATVVLSSETNGDSDPEGEGSIVVTPVKSSVAINVKGTGADKNRVISSVYGDSTVEITSLSSPGGASSGIESKTKPKKATVEVKSLPSPGHTTLTRSSASGDTGSVLVSVDTNSDNDPEGDYSAVVMPGTCSVAIKTKGTGADKNRVISTTNQDSALQVLTADLDGDEDPEGEGALIVTPGTCSVAIKTKGTGADPNRVTGGTTPDSARFEVASGDEESIAMRVRPTGGGTMGSSTLTVLHDEGLAGSSSVQVSSSSTESAMNLSEDGLVTYHVSSSDGMQVMDNSGIVVTLIDRAGNAAFSNSVGVGVSSPTHPIEHSSGAHLTAGGTWTNASDVNLKENFENVDGAELLDQLSHLPITSWNYKNEGASARHIGPTAQDFQKTFGVGSDGKSISTIDPSGIALAAIKELEGRNRELSQQNDLLQEKLEALMHRVEQLERSDRAK